jgi:hypothetical protein
MAFAPNQTWPLQSFAVASALGTALDSRTKNAVSPASGIRSSYVAQRVVDRIPAAVSDWMLRNPAQRLNTKSLTLLKFLGCIAAEHRRINLPNAAPAPLR